MPSETNGRLADRVNGGSGSLQFDYDCLPSAVAKFLKGQADRIKRHCVTSIIQIGKALLEAKRHLSHGEFLRWVEAEVGLPARTAQAYMRIASWASAKGATVAHLAPSTLYLLSASNTPKEFVADVLSRMEAGESIAPSVLRKELVALRGAQERRRAAAEGLTQQGSSNETVTDAIKRETGGSATIELVAIFMRGLSEVDFARVRDIATSDTVLSDPQFAKNLANAFLSCGMANETTYGPISHATSVAHERNFEVQADELVN
jgi:Protein of unknown function (DUF3102)